MQKKVGLQPDYFSLLQKIMRLNPDKGAEFATELANDDNGPLVDIEKVFNIRLFTFIDLFLLQCLH